ncbi:MAG: Fic family protein, partial [Coriobacteriaceae bacterium]|nr:Fic family protein [Coriobacteriaceae bacterium]
MLPAYRKALRDLYTADVNKLLLDLREYRKRINRFLVENENSPALRLQQDRALTASTLASSRMDGNDVSESRLIELAKQDTEPTSNKEREAMGARFAISTVEDNFRFIRVSTGAISQLHRDFFRYSTDSDGGRWADNDSPAFYAGELNRMNARRFGGELATKRAMLRDACDNYRQAVARREFDPLVEACMFTLDVLNIQPFASGNGRLARLLFQMLAYQNGYMAPRYVSICERLERLGEQFEQTVAACPRVVPAGASEYDAETSYEPFVLMMLEALLDCCREFESQY